MSSTSTSAAIVRGDIMICALALTSTFLVTSVEAANVSQVHWRRTFTSDVITPGNRTVLKQLTRKMCAYRCLEDPSCRSFAHQEESATCWMYGHLVDFAVVGANSTGTRFYWPVLTECPAPYTLTSGVCHWTGAGKTWLQARDHCRDDGGHLFIANTPEKLDLVKDKTFVYFKALGGQRLKGTWYWLNGDPITGNWTLPGPDRGAGCLYVFDKFGDMSCDLFFYGNFECEIPYMSP